MRITGGTLKGQRITCPPGIIRPAMDRMRESVFAILGPLDGLAFLDLFSGSGLMGIEAYSRGATRITMVEGDHKKRATLSANAELTKGRASVFISPVERFVQRSAGTFDIVFCDPPFPYRFKLDLLERIAASTLVVDDGRVLIHFPEEDRLPEQAGSLCLEDRRSYGRSIVHFYRQKRLSQSGTL